MPTRTCRLLPALGLGICLAAGTLRADDAPAPAPEPAASRYEDRVAVSEGDATAVMWERAQPYIQVARETFAQTRRDYLAGKFPETATLYVTTVLQQTVPAADPAEKDQLRFEYVFIQVRGFDGDTVEGVLASDIRQITTHSRGQAMRLATAAIIDWCLVLPDGEEAGNLVGRFLELWNEGRVAIVCTLHPATAEAPAHATFLRAISGQGQDAGIYVSDAMRAAAATAALSSPLVMDQPEDHSRLALVFLDIRRDSIMDMSEFRMATPAEIEAADPAAEAAPPAAGD